MQYVVIEHEVYTVDTDYECEQAQSLLRQIGIEQTEVYRTNVSYEHLTEYGDPDLYVSDWALFANPEGDHREHA
jgi:hypothetical protein